MDKKRIIDIAKLVVPSTAGVLLFLVPVSYGESQEMLSGIIVSWLKSSLEGVSVPLLVCMVSASAVLSLWHRISPIPFISRHDGLDAIFSPSRFWIAVRVGGAAMMLAVFLGIGPAELVSEGTGGNMLYTVAPTCAAWYLIGGVFLPLLTDYGFVDLFASLLRGVAQPLFRIPGRSVANCLSSWFGSSVCGTYLTISQYEKGFYTGREAATIISCFSILSQTIPKNRYSTSLCMVRAKNAWRILAFRLLPTCKDTLNLSPNTETTPSHMFHITSLLPQSVIMQQDTRICRHLR